MRPRVLRRAEAPLLTGPDISHERFRAAKHPQHRVARPTGRASTREEKALRILGALRILEAQHILEGDFIMKKRIRAS